MAIVHDVAEAIVGDITPHDNIPREEKHRREHAAIQEMKELLGTSTTSGGKAVCVYCLSAHFIVMVTQCICAEL
jgi:HD domain